MTHTTKATLKNRIISGFLAFLMIAGIFGTWPIAIFAEEAKENTVDVWDGSIANSFGGGSGTENDPYQIYTGAELAYLASSTNSGNAYGNVYFKLMNDIDLNGIAWTPIGALTSAPFEGNFDGNFFSVRNVKINFTITESAAQGAGFFGNLKYATVQNLGIVGCNYNVVGGRTGGLCGVLHKSTVSNCFAIGELTFVTKMYPQGEGAGGLVGDMQEESTISNSYAVCNISTEDNNIDFFIGGLVGLLCVNETKHITNCYANATITSAASSKYYGGLVGKQYLGDMYIKNCFSVGTINGHRANRILGGRENYNLYECSIKNTYFVSGGTDSFGGFTAEGKDFTSPSWVASTLGWDLESVWTFDYENDYAYPVLQGFGASGEAPEACEHSYGVTDRADATCVTSGYVRYTCNNCGDWYEEIISAPGHIYENNVCTVCGQGANYIPVSSLGYKSNAEAIEDGKTIYFDLWTLWGAKGYTDKNGNECPQWVAYNDETVYFNKEYNDSVSGLFLWQTYGSVLEIGGGYDEYVAILVQNACNHDYVEAELVEPTCTTDGYIRYTCTECGESKDELLSSLGHTTDDGVCERCGEYLEAPKADLWDGTVANGFGGGSGTENDPYLIYTGAELAYLASSTNGGNSYSGKYFKLMNNIDLNGIEWAPIGKGKDYSSSTYAFCGYFDGSGMVISNLTQTKSRQFSGLFGVICNADVSNLGINNANINVVYSGYYCLAGGLAGSAANSNIVACYVTNSVVHAECQSGLCAVGGLVGELYSGKEIELSNCFANCEVTSYGSTNTAAGGLIGIIDWDSGSNVYRINSCYTMGTVYSNCSTGGFAGLAWSDIIYMNNCFANATVTGGSPRGAFIGRNNSASLYLNNCYYGNTQSNSVGSAISTNVENFKSYEWITTYLGWDFANVWTFDYESGYEYPVLQGFGMGGGDIHAHNYVETERAEPTCMSDGYIRYTCTECDRSYDETIPALAHEYTESERVEPTCQYDGYIRYTCPMCGDYYDDIFYAISHEYTETERVEPTCQYEGYVRYTCSLCGDYYDDVLPTIRHIVGEDNYCTMCGEYIEAPKADIWDGTVANGFGGGSGTENDPYLIYTGAELAYLASSTNSGNSYSGKYFMLMNNIDLCGIEWTPIGVGSNYSVFSTAFRGNFDGQFHTISGLYITKTTSRNVGLFGTVYNATIQNLQVGDAYVAVEQDGNSGSTSAGILIGSLDGSNMVSHISVSGEVSVRTLHSGICSVAAVIGYTHYNANITVNNVSAIAMVSGYCSGHNSYVGGIIGVKNNSSGSVKVNNCIFIGSVSASDYSAHSYAGGIVGISCGGENIQNCIFIGEIHTDNTRDAVCDYFQSTPKYSNCYYNANFTSTRGTYLDLDKLQSQTWFESYLGWDFANVWTFDGINDFTYPVLQGFDGVGGNVHAHNYVETERVEPTCQYDGYIRYTCTECDRSYDETIPALAHEYTESERVEPTCQYDGYIRYTCPMCGDYYDDIFYAISHEYTETERVEPTCQYEGYVRYTCSLCGDYYDDILYTISHEYTETERVEPTCQYEGYVRYTCPMCGDYYDDVLVTIRHNIGEDQYCTMCGEYIDQRPADILVVQNGEPWGHGSNKTLMQNMLSAGSINSYKIVTDSAFHSMDLNAYSVIYVVMNSDALNSSNVNAMYDKLVDFISAGGTVIYGMCWQSSQNVTLPAGAEVIKVNGNYGTIVDYDHPIMSGELTDGIRFPDKAQGNSLNHTYVSNLPENANVILKDNNNHAILVEYGYGNGSVILSCLTWEFYYNDSYSYAYNSYDDLIVYAASLSGSGLGGGGNACKHSYVEIERVEPTCTTDGYTKYACEHCGNEYTGNYVSKWGHTVGEWIIDYEPTCTTSGRKHSECAVCGQQLENIYISSLGHNYVTVVAREVTCTTPGILTHTCERCGDSYSTYVYSEHAYAITEQVQPTCYTDGYTVYTCSKCDDDYTETIPGGHDYKSTITKVATSEEDGEITYTCEACGDSYTEVIPAREAANVLLVQDKYPWGENNNAALLNKMLQDGYITGWDLTTTSNFANVDLGAYNVILIANDQSSATYNQLNQLNDTLMQFATAGGVVIYGACDSGWSGGYINYSLPEGVVKKNFYSRYNYIVDGDHLIVSGILTDGKALTDNLLNGNYCSHSAFDANTLPAGANVILQDAHGDATLVEYAVGDGHIILSGLTWEFYYNRNCYDGRTNTSYTKNVYDDLVMYALYLSDPCEHIYDEGEIVAPTCTEDGYTKHTCQNCGAIMKDNVVEALGHTEGEWIVTVEPTQYQEGLKELCCTVCGEVLKSEVMPPVGGAAARVESDFDYVVIGDEIIFTLIIENCDPIKSLSVVPVFDTNVFEIVSAEWLLMDAMIQNIEEGTYKSISVWSDYIDVNCAVYCITLKAKQFTDDTSITFSLKVEDQDGVVTVVPKSVAVTECPHAQTSVELIDGIYHANVCDLCGYAVMEEHIYDDIYDLVCDACGYERGCQHPETYIVVISEAHHAHICYYCNETVEAVEHTYDDIYDLVCDECGYTRACEHPETYIGMTDAYYHAHVCYYCGDVETNAHSYDDMYDLVCDECGYTRACEHPETVTVTVDGNYHAQVCKVCGHEEREAHTYDNGYDLVCDACGYERECPHTDCYVECVDDFHHVHVCNYCGNQKMEEHVYNQNDIICKECGYANVINGDVDNDGDIDSDDAVYLVYNVFFGGNDYPVLQSLDFDGDGKETTDDAIYLLYSIYFGEESYPLH